MMYRCPVCGFDQMPFPPEDNNICSCCGTEFGYHDLRFSHADLRRHWQANGAKWFSMRMHPPAGWNPTNQVNRLLLRGTEVSSRGPVFKISPPQTGSSSYRSPHRKKRVARSVQSDDPLYILRIYSRAS